MQVVVSEQGRFVLNMARGEELLATLMAWLKSEGVTGATFTGLGAADSLELAYYNLGTKTYERHTVEEEVEILSLTGNVATLKGEVALHIHGVFGRKDLSTFGGHLFSLKVSGACEIHLATFAKPFVRMYDEATGLNLLCSVK